MSNKVAGPARSADRRLYFNVPAFEDKLSAFSNGSNGMFELADKYFGNILSFDKAKVDRFYKYVKDAISAVESELRNLKK